MTFADRVAERTLELDSRLCLGLDPRPEAHPSTDPAAHRVDPESLARAVERHALDTVEACADLLCAVKPQVAFFEALGLPGLAAMWRIVAACRTMGLPVVLDAKRGDIASTAEAYARAWLTGPAAGEALTANPYLGMDSLEPFLRTAREHGGLVFALVKTSNPGSADLQDLPTPGGRVCEVLADRLAAEAARGGEGYGAVGAVVGATHPDELAGFRRRLPGVLLLLPGLGAQGGTAYSLAPAFDARGLGAVATSSRSVHYASRGKDFAGAAREAARGLRDGLNAALGS